MPEDSVDLRVRLRGATETKHDADKVARAVDNIGDQADQTTRRLDRMNVASGGFTRSLRSLSQQSSRTRVSLGPFSTSLRNIPLAVGGATLALRAATPAVLGFGEAVATVAGGGAAAGGVGLLALAQAGGVATLAMGNLQKALGGNATALKNLNPHMLKSFTALSGFKQQLGDIAAKGMAPGLTKGIHAAMGNAGVFKGITRNTSRALGGLAADAGTMVGSKGWGRDLKTLGGANVKVITNLGHAGLFAADGLRHILVQAAPLAVTLSKDIEHGAKLADVWLKNARNSGEMAKFFHRAGDEIHTLVSIGGHAGRGIINLFGSHDVDGAKTLRNLDHITANFERWTNSPAVRRNVGDAIIAEIPKAVGAVMTAVANNLPVAGALGAKTFINGFMHADVWGKLLAGGFLAKRLGLFNLGKKILGSGGGLGGGLLSKARPIPVWVVNEHGMPGKGGSPLSRTVKTVAKGAAGAGLADLGIAGLAGAGGLAGVGAALFGVDRLDRAVNGKDYGMAGKTAQQVRDQVAANQRDRLRGMGGTPAKVKLDAQGFPSLVVKSTLVIDGKPVARASQVAVARQSARRAGP